MTTSTETPARSRIDWQAWLSGCSSQRPQPGDLPTASPTVALWCDLWWKRHGMTRLKVSNRSGYRSRIEQYIKPAIGRVRLDKLAPEHVYRLHEYVIQTKGLSPTTAKGAHAVLSSILADAVIEGRATRNAAQRRCRRSARHAGR